MSSFQSAFLALALALSFACGHRPEEHLQRLATSQGDDCGHLFDSQWQAIEYLRSFWVVAGSDSTSFAECFPQSNATIALGLGFDVTCHMGNIVAVNINIPSATARLRHLSCALSGLQNVHALFLANSNISGKIGELNFSRLQEPRKLDLRHCNVDVHLGELGAYTFEVLKLSGKQVHGSVRDMNWKKLKFLDLRDTNVTGDVSDVSDVPLSSPLKGLWLQNTRVEGDIQVLVEKHGDLMYLNVAHTLVAGMINDSWINETMGQKLRELNVSNSSVGFNLTKPRQRWRDTPAAFPELMVLDVSFLPLKMSVEDFLYPLTSHMYLSILHAVQSELHGELSGTLRHRGRPVYCPLTELRMRNNNITSLTEQPRKLFLDVAFNPVMTIADEYFKAPLLLDIRSTQYRITEDKFKKLFEPTNITILTSKEWTCKGVQLKGRSDPLLMDFDPNVFAPSLLCKCNDGFTGEGTTCSPSCTHGKVTAEDNVAACACDVGQARLPAGLDEVEGSQEFLCVDCVGEMKNKSCASLSEHTDCGHGFHGTLCASCSDGFRSVGYASCKSCGEWEMHHRGPVLTAAGLSVFVGLCCTLWYFVWRPPGESDTEKGYRTAEMMEQGLLLLSYVQLLTGVQATQSYTAQSRCSPWSEIWQLRAEFAMQLLSVQCVAGHQRGREIEILASIYSLPVLWVLGLAVATCRGSPFLALKFGIVATSMLFIGVIKVIFPNLSWCVREAGGKELGKLAFFHERPFQKCTDSDDPLAPHLLLGLSINAALIPVGLLLTGWYIARRMRSVDSLAGCIRPGRLARCGADSVELILWEGVPTDVAASIDLGKYEHLPKAALCVYAAAHTAHLAELMCASSVEVAKTEAGLTIRVPFSETWAMLELKYQQHCMAVTRMDADMLGRNLLFRLMAKNVLKEGPLWHGTRSSFERFSDKDPLICEGVQKVVILCMAQLCFKGEVEQFGWTALFLFLVGWGIFSTKPYGSRSRNNLAAVCYISLSLFTFSMWIANAMSGEPAAAASARIAGMGAAMCPFLYGLHLHLMPGDVALQAYAVLPVIEKALSGRVAETQAAELPPIHWKKEAWLPCLHTLLMHYRGWSARMHSRQMLVDSSGQSLGRGGLQSIRRLL